MKKTYTSTNNSCQTCGCNVYRKDNDLCATCNPSQIKDQTKIKRAQEIRRVIEDHQNRNKKSWYDL